ncbi:peroxidase family protein [Actinoplanes sp. RD1]|uniref:peroxidase family protein n=1 Tax=Actinoplanes sp. RD1 TaxID=3064538 RepID=UPI00274248C5|nr:peroxidase family protein [Actinoplanes sp. RD1]
MTATTVHTVRDQCLAPGRTVDAPSAGARYGRMFPDLPPLVVDPEVLYAAGTPGGLCDATSFPSPAGHEAAGWPFFGQLIAHDITADRSPVGPHADVVALRNARSPRLDLEMIHADGPVGAPYLYDADDPAKLLTAPGGRDLPRNSQGTALIGDPRNDVHVFVAHLHLAFLHAHNRLVDRLRADGVPEDDLFPAAKRALTWHYQWIVVHDFLPRLVGRAMVADILALGPRWFAPRPGEAFIPLEFADAAYRYGHGQIRHRYRLQPDGPQFPLFPALFGHGPIPPEHELDWALIFDMPGRPPAQRAKRLDGGLPASLIALPREVTGDVPVDAYRSLAVRDLLRGSATALPAGEVVAEAMGVRPLAPDETGEPWAGRTPLWLYVLKEAQHREGGDRLGPVGGRIVAEVLLGLLRADSGSFLVADPGWRPTLPAHGPHFGLADLL